MLNKIFSNPAASQPLSIWGCKHHIIVVLPEARPHIGTMCEFDFARNRPIETNNARWIWPCSPQVLGWSIEILKHAENFGDKSSNHLRSQFVCYKLRFVHVNREVALDLTCFKALEMWQSNFLGNAVLQLLLGLGGVVFQHYLPILQFVAKPLSI